LSGLPRASGAIYRQPFDAVATLPYSGHSTRSRVEWPATSERSESSGGGGKRLL
jgi:hypothetical protein